MIRSRALLLAAMLLAPQAFLVRPALSADFFVFPLKVSLPVRMVELGTDPDSIVERKLTESDVVNLALGRPLSTKLDKKKELLAVAIARFPEDAHKAKILVVDPSQNGLAQITAVVAEPLALDREIALLDKGKKGEGTVTGQVKETTLGNPAKNALHAASGWASGSGESQDQKGTPKGTFKGIVAGRLSLTITEGGQTKAFAGFIVNGKASVTGKPISLFSDGEIDPGCGNGIIEPQLGEECEFNDQSACPGHCSACTCRVCGNGRVDPGEICDPPSNDICDALGVPSYCKLDCSGCTFCGDGRVDAPEECDYLAGADTACPGQCDHNTCLCPH